MWYYKIFRSTSERGNTVTQVYSRTQSFFTKLYVPETCEVDLELEDRSLSCDINTSSMYISDDKVSGPDLPYLIKVKEKPKVNLWNGNQLRMRFCPIFKKSAF
jgi:hypothetical protein